MNLKLFDFFLLLIKIVLLQKKIIKKLLNFRGVTYFFPGGIVKKQEFGYLGTVLVAEKKYLYKLLVLYNLIFSKDYKVHFASLQT